MLNIKFKGYMVNVQNEMEAFEVKGYEEDWVRWKMRWKLKC